LSHFQGLLTSRPTVLLAVNVLYYQALCIFIMLATVFIFVERMSKLMSHNFFKHFVCYVHASVIGTLCTITDSILLYRCVSMGGHIIPEAEKSNTMLWLLFQGLYQLHTHFCPLCMLRCFQFLEKIGNLIITFEKSCLVLKNVRQFLFFWDVLNLLKHIIEN